MMDHFGCFQDHSPGQAQTPRANSSRPNRPAERGTDKLTPVAPGDRPFRVGSAGSPKAKGRICESRAKRAPIRHHRERHDRRYPQIGLGRSYPQRKNSKFLSSDSRRPKHLKTGQKTSPIATKRAVYCDKVGGLLRLNGRTIATKRATVTTRLA